MTRLSQAISGQPWAISLDALGPLSRDVALGDMKAIRKQLAQIEAAVRQDRQPQGQITVIPIHGVITHRQTLMGLLFGVGTTVQQLRAQFRNALADPSVSGIVFDVASPGGEVDGIPELAAEIRAARGQKPMVAVANALCASAAYWLASQADELIASPSARLGSVGVYLVHEDESGADEQAGIKKTVISAGKHKANGIGGLPLSEDGRTEAQKLVDEFYTMFTGDVAKGRGVSASAVRDGYGQGNIVSAREAVQIGMADRVDTIDGAFARLARGKVGMRAEVSGWSVAASDFLEGPTAETMTATAPVEATVETEQAPESSPNGAYRIALAKARARSRRPLATR